MVLLRMPRMGATVTRSVEQNEASLRGRTCRTLRNVWGDTHGADLTIPAGSSVLVKELRARTESDDIYIVEYDQHYFRVMRDNLEVSQ